MTFPQVKHRTGMIMVLVSALMGGLGIGLLVWCRPLFCGDRWRVVFWILLRAGCGMCEVYLFHENYFIIFIPVYF